MDALHVALVAVAGVAGGMANAIAGGGSLLTFPVLVACGLPAVTASLTNTVAMCPGYLGAAFGQRRDLVGQRSRALAILPVGAIGGVVGALLLLHTDAHVFDLVVPFLLLFAAALLGFGPKLRALFQHRGVSGHGWAVLPVGVAAIYGGYFGAGLGVIVLSVLAVVVDDTFIRINALRQTITLAVNVAAAVVFIASGQVQWVVAIVMAISALVGGVIGGTIATRVPANVLRTIVVVVALAVSGYYFTKLL